MRLLLPGVQDSPKSVLFTVCLCVWSAFVVGKRSHGALHGNFAAAAAAVAAAAVAAAAVDAYIVQICLPTLVQAYLTSGGST
jgi:hypothetical protein